MTEYLDYDLSGHNTFGIKASCRRYLEFNSEDDLSSLLESLTTEDFPLLILGGGSNLLMTADYPHTVIHSALKGYETTTEGNDIYLRVGSGETWDEIVALCVSNGWYGTENLSLIPGEVGASAVQNIGAYGAEIKDILHKVEAIEIATGRKVEFTNEECGYSYRYSKFKGEWKDRYIITYVTYRLSKTFSPRTDYGNINVFLESKGITVPTAQQLRDAVVEIRRSKLPDPEITGNAGSFFVNPIVDREKFEDILKRYPGMPHYILDENHVKIPAGWMIDTLGWKGRSVGNAGVHEKQALVLVNRGGATGREILNLCDTIRADVKREFGIDIKPEVNII